MPDEYDPAALRSAFMFRGFSKYLRWYLRQHFRGVRISRQGLPAAASGRALIVYGNHASWWDPLTYLFVAGRLMPERTGFGVMDAAMLEKYAVFKKLGVFGVSPDLRGAIRFLSVGEALLRDPSHALFVTPQGQFTDARDRPIVLRPGVAHLAARMPDVAVLPLATEYVFWNEAKPEALIRFGEPIQTTGQAPKRLNAIMESALTRVMDDLAGDVRARDPDRFVPLLRARSGVGGPYDVWRRARANLRGQAFDPSHEGER